MSKPLHIGVPGKTVAKRGILAGVEHWSPVHLPAYDFFTRVLKRVRSDQAQVILMIPDWTLDHLANLGGSSVQETGQGSAPKPAQSTPSCMEIKQQQLIALDPPPEVVNVILAPRYQATKSIYSRRWDKVMAWYGVHKIDPLQANQLDVLLFVLSLAKQGLALGTIKGYLLALLAFLRLLNQPSFFKLPDVIQFIKGLTRVFPPKL